MNSTTTGPSQSSDQALHDRYPMSSKWEFTLKNGEKVSGEVYCTDLVSNVIALQQSMDVRMISVGSIEESKLVGEASSDSAKIVGNLTHTKKILEEREKRAVRLAEESLRHLNPKASPKGQVVFDRLLKACNEVVWQGQSIIVLNQIQVDPPYDQENCKLLEAGSAQAGGSLERVQKIVAATSI